MTLATRLARLERERPPCCDGNVTLLRLSDGDPPPEPDVCPGCGRPQGRVVIREVIVQRINGVPLFVAPEWATFVPPDEVHELMQMQLQGNAPAWDEAERKARRRQAAGDRPFYIHEPGERQP
jgi:hypothetical protein